MYERTMTPYYGTTEGQLKLAHRQQVLLEEAAAHQQYLCEPSTSTEMSAEQNVEYFCSKCNEKYIEGTRLNWIECSMCTLWCHRKCDASLEQQKAWLAAQMYGFVYMCPTCEKMVEWNVCYKNHPCKRGKEALHDVTLHGKWHITMATND